MRKVVLDMKEMEKYEVIKKLVETSGNKNNAAIKLDVTKRTINRLIKVYKTYGKEGFRHKNKDRPPINKIDEITKNKIIKLYKDDYQEANISHFKEIVNEDLFIKVSNETIRKWLIKEGILSPKAHKKTKKRLKIALKDKLKATKSNKESNNIKIKIEKLDKDQAHPRRPRKKYTGEMIQMDASELEWVKGAGIWHLHLAIDDADGKAVGAYFDYEETLNGYYNVFYQILTNYGIPALFYTDRRTVFEYERKKKKKYLFDDYDTFTQFSYACHKLGVEIKTTSLAQAKGRIERLNQTFQSRLPIELKRANVHTIDEANEFLKHYLPKFNKQFALQLNITKTVYEAQPELKLINQTLSTLSVRTLDKGCCVKYKNNNYIPINSFGSDVYLESGRKVIMIETFDKQLLMNFEDNIYRVRKINLHEQYSKEFDYKVDQGIEVKSIWRPPVKHPWRTNDFLNFLAKQKHRQSV